MVPETPPVVLPSRVDRGKLGTLSADYKHLKKHDDAEKEMVVEGGTKMREDLEDDGRADRYEKMQPRRPNVDEGLIDRRTEQLWDFHEPDGTVVQVWCRGVVVGVKGNSKVHIRWDDAYLKKGDPKVTEERFLVSKWNKHVEESWRFVISED